MHTHMKLPTTACSLVVALLLAGEAPAGAQDHRASIRVTIVEAALAPLPDVEIRITREATNEVRTTRSDTRGRFSVPELAPGAYRIDVKHAGFGAFVARTSLAINQDFWLDVPLQPGALIQ